MQKKRLKIVYVVSHYLPSLGGVEIHAQQISQAFSKNHDVSIVATNFGGKKFTGSFAVLNTSLFAPIRRSTSDRSVTVHSLIASISSRLKMLPMALRATPKLRRWYFHPINRWTHSFYRIATLKKMIEVIREADVVHALAHGDIGWVAERAAHMEGCAFVCTPFVHPHQWGDGPTDVEYYKRCDAVIGLVETDCKYLETIGVNPKKLHTIGVSPNLPDSVDGSAFRRDRHFGDSPIVLYVGRMMAKKGAESVVKAATLVWKENPNVQFVFIGPAEGNESSIFSGCDSRISYLGRVDSQTKANAMAACNLLIMPSVSEILPTVYLEAWLLGKPVIGGQAPGLKDLVEGNQAGVNVSQDPGAIAVCINAILDSPEDAKVMGQNGLELVQKNYTVEAVIKQLEEVYRRVLEDRSICES